MGFLFQDTKEVTSVRAEDFIKCSVVFRLNRNKFKAQRSKSRNSL